MGIVLIGERGSGRWKTVSWDEALAGILDGDAELGTPGLRSWYRYAPQDEVMGDWDAVQSGTLPVADFEARWGSDLIDVQRPELGPKSNLLAVLGGLFGS